MMNAIFIAGSDWEYIIKNNPSKRRLSPLVFRQITQLRLLRLHQVKKTTF